MRLLHFGSRPGETNKSLVENSVRTICSANIRSVHRHVQLTRNFFRKIEGVEKKQKRTQNVKQFARLRLERQISLQFARISIEQSSKEISILLLIVGLFEYKPSSPFLRFLIINNSTLNRRFSFHFILPLIIVIIVFLHLTILLLDHFISGSTNTIHSKNNLQNYSSIIHN